MDSLRQEIQQSQQRRADLIKWKLVLVSVLGATGLGLTNSPNVPYAELVLCGIPFVCTYVDLLCQHHALNLVVIGEFIRSQESGSDIAEVKYEKFSLAVRQIPLKKRMVSAYDLERINIIWSSIVFSASIVVYAAIQPKLTTIPIVLAGCFGVILSLWVQKMYRIRRDVVRRMSTQFFLNSPEDN